MKKLLVLTTLIILSLTVSSALALTLPNKEPVDRILFIRYKDGRIREIRNIWGWRQPTCYSLLGIKWSFSSLPLVTYVNPHSDTYMTSDAQVSAITSAEQTWDGATSKTLFSTPIVDPYAVWGLYDGKNSYVFGTILDHSIISMTSVWYTRYTRQIVDYDVLFSNYYSWKDCITSACSTASTSTDMDLQDIATHETGHGLGLGDVYQNACSAMTMYRYASPGETLKRTLEQPDITGLQKIYGI